MPTGPLERRGPHQIRTPAGSTASEPRLPRTVGGDSYPQRAEALEIPRLKRGDRVGSGKQVSRSAHIGDAGIALIHQRVSAMDHVWHERTVDAGINGTIELRDPATGEVSNCPFQVQSKASDNDFPGETADRFHYDCDERDLDYWMKSSMPVLLVCSHPKRGEAWWAHIQPTSRIPPVAPAEVWTSTRSPCPLKGTSPTGCSRLRILTAARTRPSLICVMKPGSRTCCL